jgi:hypothetical protein
MKSMFHIMDYLLYVMDCFFYRKFIKFDMSFILTNGNNRPIQFFYFKIVGLDLMLQILSKFNE